MATTKSKRTPIVNEHDRYYCRRCNCEVGQGSTCTVPVRPVCTTVQEMLTAGLPGGPKGTPPGGDHPLAFDPDCECDCHAAWRLAYRTPAARVIAAKPKRTRKAPTKRAASAAK